MVKVSVIIPVYNCEKYLIRCLDSVLNQSLSSIEIICVDDASTDSSRELLISYKERFENVRLIFLEKNSRQGAARNRGVAIARGEYVAFVDSDDWVTEDMYSELYIIAKTNDYDVVECNFDMVNSFGETKQNVSRLPDKYVVNELTLNKRKELIVRGGSVWAKIYKRSFLLSNQIEFPEHILYEDNFFVPVVYMNLESFYFVDKPLYHYFENQDSITRKKDTKFLYDRIRISEMLTSYAVEKGLYSSFRSELNYLYILYNIINSSHLCLRTMRTGHLVFLREQRKLMIKMAHLLCNKWVRKDVSLKNKVMLGVLLISPRIYYNLYVFYLNRRN